MYQKCPICNGTGMVENGGLSTSCYSQCPVCGGARIISEVTGIPPARYLDIPKEKWNNPEIKDIINNFNGETQRKFTTDIIPGRIGFGRGKLSEKTCIEQKENTKSQQ